MRFGVVGLAALIGCAALLAGAVQAPGIEAPKADPDALRARADAQFEAIAALLPAIRRPGPEAAAAYREAYVATVLRAMAIEPCGDPSYPAPGGNFPPAGSPPLSIAGADTVSSWGLVFLDLDANGVPGPNEQGIASVTVSNGTAAGPLGNGVKLSGPDGSFTFTTPLANSRFIFVTVPSGYTATNSFFHRLSAAGPDTAYFGLRLTPETADPIFRWVQISDPHIVDAPNAGELSTDLTEIEGLAIPPDFVVVTGDLVQTGAINSQFQNFLAGLQGHPTRVHVGYGDHDADGSALQVANFETHIGPTYYSFDYGGIHFVMYNDIDAADEGGLFIQFPWLFQDLATVPNEIPIVICKHTMPLANEINLYNSLPGVGVIGAFSGHWHGSRVRLLEGIFDVNTPPMRYAGIDKSSRGFRINDMNNGAIETEFRLAGVNNHIRIAMPANSDTVIAGPITVRVNAYNSQDPIESGLFLASGPVSSGDIPLTRDGPWAWRGVWDATSAPEGLYTLTAELLSESGAPLLQIIHFRLSQGTIAFPDPYTDWPTSKHDPAGTGFTPEELEPPLRVAWVRHLGGRNNVESPVVAGGRVYVGTSNISTVSEAALNCFDATTGALLWRFPARTDVKSTPAVADGRVFFSNSIGRVFALNAASGALLWSTQLGDSLTRWEMTSPTVSQGIVYAGGLPAMSALDAASGNILWQRVGESGSTADFVPAIYSAPVVNESAAVFTTRGGIFAFDPVTGNPLWSHPGAAKLHRSAALTGTDVYSAGGVFGSQVLVAYNAATGDTTHQAQYSQSEATSSPVLALNRVIVAHGGNAQGGFPNGLLQGWSYNLDFDLVWTYEVGPPISSSRPYQRSTGSINSTPAVAGGAAVYFGADDGFLHALNPTTGAELWRYDFGVPVRSSPAIAGNMLFITTEDGSLYAFVSTVIGTTAADPNAAPLSTRLLGNTPNPFNPVTTIRFTLGPAGAPPQPITLRIFDIQGRVVRHLLAAKLPPGHHTARWDGRNDQLEPAASGIYFYTLAAGERTFEGRMALVK